MTTSNELLIAMRQRLELEASAISTLAGDLGLEAVEIVEVLATCKGKVFVTGSGTSGTIAQRMAHLFSVSGTPSVFLQPADALHGSLGALESGDIVIAISRGGGSAEINDVISRAKQRGVITIALTNTPVSALTRAADYVQIFPTPDEVDPGNLLAMGTNLMHAAWGDAVAIVLMRVKGHDWQEVLFTHPSGSVGALSELPDSLSPLSLAPSSTKE